MKSGKRLVLFMFVLLWIAGFILTAPAPLYRWLFTRSKQLPLDTPYQLFEASDWTHPNNYAELGRAFRDLSIQATGDSLYLYLDSMTSNLHTETYQRYFHEYALIWAYPRPINFVADLSDIPADSSVIISSTVAPPLNCQMGKEHLFLCQS